MIRGVLAQDVQDIWPKLRPLLEATLARDPLGYYSANDVLQGLINRDLQLWLNNDCDFFGVTEIVQYPQKKACRILWGGGKISDELRDCFNVIKAWAAQNDCHSIEVIGRCGWSKVLDLDTLHWVAYEKL